MKRFAALLLGASVAVWTTGCAEPPTAEVVAARAKVQATAAEGTIYAPDAYQTAQDAVAQLDAEMEAQSGKFALTRSYDRVNELAAAAGTAADRVQQAVTAEKERRRTQAGQTVADARRALGEATASLERAPRADMEALKAEVAAAETSLKEADSLLSNGQLEEAQQRAEAARQAVSRINTTIEEAQAAAAEGAEQQSPDRTMLPRAVMAAGNRLPAGTYSMRVTSEQAAAVVGQPASTGRWIEFLRDGNVAGRALAVVLTAAEVREVAKSPGPGNNEVRVELLKDNDYVRVWLNQGGTHYLIHVPVA